MADPLDLSAIEFIEQKQALIKPVAADPSVIDEFVQTRYTGTLTQEVTEALKDVAPQKDDYKALETGKGGLSGRKKLPR